LSAFRSVTIKKVCKHVLCPGVRSGLKSGNFTFHPILAPGAQNRRTAGALARSPAQKGHRAQCLQARLQQYLGLHLLDWPATTMHISHCQVLLSKNSQACYAFEMQCPTLPLGESKRQSSRPPSSDATLCWLDRADHRPDVLIRTYRSLLAREQQRKNGR
jgi:hypothetical protein